MRNIVATLCQIAAVGLLLVGLWLVTPFLAAAVVVGGAGWVLAPDKPL